MKKLFLALMCFFTLSFSTHADELSTASKAAIADGVTTGLAFVQGHREANPLIGTSYPMLILVTGLKIAAAEKYKDHKPTQRFMTAVWGGGAASNVVVAIFASSPAGLLVGVATGWYLYEKEDL